MSQKDYIRLAAAFKLAFENANPDEERGIFYASARVADVLQADNPKFDRSRFFKACERG